MAQAGGQPGAARGVALPLLLRCRDDELCASWLTARTSSGTGSAARRGVPHGLGHAESAAASGRSGASVGATGVPGAVDAAVGAARGVSGKPLRVGVGALSSSPPPPPPKRKPASSSVGPLGPFDAGGEAPSGSAEPCGGGGSGAAAGDFGAARPSWPYVSSPHVSKVPLLVTKHEWLPPAPRATTGDCSSNEAMPWGRAVAQHAPSPSCPWLPCEDAR